MKGNNNTRSASCARDSRGQLLTVVPCTTVRVSACVEHRDFAGEHQYHELKGVSSVRSMRTAGD